MTSQPTLIGVVDAWRIRREFIHEEAERYVRVARGGDAWAALRWGAGLWEVRFGGR